MQAVILAGGKGTRLKPFTNIIPKPLVPLGEVPVLEVLLRQLKKYGVTEVILAVNHMARLIEAFFGDGSELGLSIKYSIEGKVLGTAGPLGILDNLDDDILVLNGDLLTTLDFSKLFDYHLENDCDITIGTYLKEVKIDLGVLEHNDGIFMKYIEKPTYSFPVSMGVYVVNKAVLKNIPNNVKYDLPELVQDSHRAGSKILCYTGKYDWLDIGRVEDYEHAIQVFNANINRYLDK